MTYGDPVSERSGSEFENARQINPSTDIRGARMANQIRHFDISCDDIERAKKFYEAVFGWRIEA